MMLLGRDLLSKTKRHPTWCLLLKRVSLGVFFRLNTSWNEPCTEWCGWNVKSWDTEGPFINQHDHCVSRTGDMETNTASKSHFHCVWPICIQTKEVIFKRGALLFLFWSLGMAVVRKKRVGHFHTSALMHCVPSLFPLFLPHRLLLIHQWPVLDSSSLLAGLWHQSSDYATSLLKNCSLFLMSEVILLSETFSAVHCLNPILLFCFH